ncbi:MAG: NADH-quinone oxidoreductase subunit C [Chloroflexi bacterium]|nr:NADH-quinone oxidoreductase subunit C [Chloroflexota bacterium]
MELERLLETAVTILKPWTIEQTAPEPERIDVYIDKASLLPAVATILEAEWGYLAAITGMDPGEDDENLEVLYHFCEGAAVVTLRVNVEKETAVLPSVCDLIPSASFFERELSEMFGIEITGTPDPSRLFLPDEWPEGTYPLRKAFQVES